MVVADWLGLSTLLQYGGRLLACELEVPGQSWHDPAVLVTGVKAKGSVSRIFTLERILVKYTVDSKMTVGELPLSSQ